MDGVYIYWFGWGFWVVATFLWPKSKKRFYCAFGILLLLLLLPYTLLVNNYSVHIIYLIILFIIYYVVAQQKRREKYLLFPVMTIAVAAFYAGFRLILLFDPVIMFVDSRWMIASLLAILSYVLATTFTKRLLVCLSGLLHGELLIKIHPLSTQVREAIGDLYFFDIVAIVSLIFGVGWVIKTVSLLLSQLSKVHLKSRNGRHYSGNQLK